MIIQSIKETVRIWEASVCPLDFSPFVQLPGNIVVPRTFAHNGDRGNKTHTSFYTRLTRVHIESA